jgi:DNA-binding transcriptional ArsR family regulator
MPRLDTAYVAGLFADRSRVAMIDVLMDSREHAVEALARAAGIAASTATEHLSRLERGGVVVARRTGRQRLVRLAGPSVAAAYEALAGLSYEREANGLRGWTCREQIRAARTCYDHLAGRLGAAIADAALAAGAVGRDFSLGPRARAWFGELGVDLEALPVGAGHFFASAPTGQSDASTCPVRWAQQSALPCWTRAGR